MKTNTLFITTMSVLLLIGVSTQAMADTPVLKSKPQLKKMMPKPPVQLKYSCPTGWQISHGSFALNSTTVCVPKKPVKMNCPPGTNPFIGTCEVGCMQIPK